MAEQQVVADDRRAVATRAVITRRVTLRACRPDLLQRELSVPPGSKGTIVRRHECDCVSIQLDVEAGFEVGGRTWAFLPAEWRPDEEERPEDSAVQAPPKQQKKPERVRGFQI